MILLIFLVTCFFIIPTILFSGNVQLKFQLIIRNINLSTFFSTLDQLFSASLTVIFFCILLYRFSYFRVSTDFLRFILLLFFFYLSIIILIHHRRGLILFLGWDGLGVTSYLLVCYYFNWKSLNGAMVTLMTNRIGDVCLFWFISILMMAPSITTSFFLYSAPTFIFITGAFTKRAQRPFRRWLPQAIRAPTPVSSLVHRRTLVTAGVYLLLKYFFFISSQFFLTVIIFFGTVTIFFAGLAASSEKDSKKIVALRTLSQLGLLTFTVGGSLPTISFLHLLTHAFFKRCIFIQVGTLIKRAFGRQERRNFSGLLAGGEITNFFLSVCSIRLCGLLFTRGFVRKDIIVSLRNFGSVGFIFQVLFFGGVVLTFVYTSRIVCFAASSTPTKIYSKNSPTPVFLCSLPLLVLGVLGGWLLINNIIIQVGAESFIDKFLPLFILSFFLLVSFTFLFGDTFFSGIIQHDSLTLLANNFLFIPRKSIDIFSDLLIRVWVKDLSVFYQNLKAVNTRWPVGGLIFIFVILFIFF